jgi:hypothetical protein
MAKTTKKRSHENKVSRTTARERAVELSKWLFGYGLASTKDFVNAASSAFQAHARATLDRAKRRAK